MLKISGIALVIALVPCSASLLGEPEDDWTGLWRVTRYYEDKLDGILHVHISRPAGNEVIVYGPSFRPLEVQGVSLTEDSFQITCSNSATQPIPFEISGKKEGTSLIGEWSFRHYQSSEATKGRLQGFRVHALETWDPWETLNRNREAGLIDITGFLAKNAPLSNLDDFMKFWNLFEPSYYALVEGWLYDEEGEGRRRDELLKAVFESLQEPRENRKWIEEFSAMILDVRDEVKPFSQAETPGMVVNSFSGATVRQDSYWSKPRDLEAERQCSCTLSLEERVFTFDPAAFHKEDDPRIQLWRAIYLVLLSRSYHRAESERMMENGLATRMALARGTIEVPEQDVKSLSMVAERWRKNRVPDQSQTFRGLPFSQDDEAILAYYFVKEVLEQRSAEDMWKMKRRELSQLWNDYLGKLESSESR